MRARWTAVVVVAVGCASAQRGSAPSAAQSAAPSDARSGVPNDTVQLGEVVSSGGAAPSVIAPSATPTAQESSVRPMEPSPPPRPAPTVNLPGGATRPPASVGGGEPASAEASIAAQERRLQAAVSLLRADPVTCRDLCGASSSICAAATEICRLTGDSERERARDPRCGRARSACADAGRQRDGACPTCPELR